MSCCSFWAIGAPSESPNARSPIVRRDTATALASRKWRNRVALFISFLLLPPKLVRQPPQGKGTQRQPEIPQCHVEVCPHRKQIRDDQAEPDSHHGRSQARPDRNQYSCGRFDGASCQHQVMAADRGKAGDPRREILIPVAEYVKKL